MTREELIKELRENLFPCTCDGECEYEDIADFIIADRKRIVEQVVLLKKELEDSKIDSLTKKYCLARVNQCLNLAGIQ